MFSNSYKILYKNHYISVVVFLLGKFFLFSPTHYRLEICSLKHMLNYQQSKAIKKNEAGFHINIILYLENSKYSGIGRVE